MATITRTYRVKIYPTRAGHQALDAALRDQCRLYNNALQERREAYSMHVGWKVAVDRETGKPRTRRDGTVVYNEQRVKRPLDATTVTYWQQSKELTQVRADDPATGRLHRTIQVGTLRRLDRAFQAFFRRAKAGETPGYPRFKPSSRYRTLICDNNVQARGMVKVGERGKGWIRIKGLPALEFRTNRALPPVGELAEFRIIRRARRVEAHLVFHTERELPVPPSPADLGEPACRHCGATGASLVVNKDRAGQFVSTSCRPCGHEDYQPWPAVNATGLNLGVHLRVTTADGRVRQGRREDTKRRKRLQRKVSRAVKGSSSRRKKVKSLAREYERQSDRRKGEAHEVTTTLVKTYGFIAVEDLAIKKMTESARGTIEDPGENVDFKTALNRRILDQGWGDILAKVQYKAESAGVGFAQVDPYNTTQDCSGCGAYVYKPPEVRFHNCPICGLALVKDVNAARNVLRRGLEVYAAGRTFPGASAVRDSTVPDGAGRRRKPRASGAVDLRPP